MKKKETRDSLGSLLDLAGVPLGSSGDSEGSVGLELLLVRGDGSGLLGLVELGEGNGDLDGVDGLKVDVGSTLGVSLLGLASLSGEDDEPKEEGKGKESELKRRQQ
jgi:hypothetical protein